jgi:SAM-dependent methyltransferase
MGVFDRAAATYGRVGPPFFAHYAGRLVALARIAEGARVLDIATGRGAVLFPAAERVGPTGAVKGIDLSDAMVRATARDAHQRGLKNVEIYRMDAEELLFSDVSFDCATCGFGLFFFPQALHALSEIRRVLKPGGCFAASTWGKEEEAWERLYDLSKAYLPPEPKPAADAAQTPRPDFETPQGMQALLGDAGFVNIQVFDEVADFTYATKEEWWATQWSHGARGTIEKIESALGPEGLARFKSEVFDRLEALTKPDGIHHLMPVLFTVAERPGGVPA